MFLFLLLFNGLFRVSKRKKIRVRRSRISVEKMRAKNCGLTGNRRIGPQFPAKTSKDNFPRAVALFTNSHLQPQLHSLRFNVEKKLSSNQA
jgi:hypothetical protein